MIPKVCLKEVFNLAIDEEKISKIVEQVVKSMKSAPKKQLGVFDNMSDALEAVNAAYKTFRSYTIEQREKMISKIREFTLEEAENLARLGVEETGMGRVEDKVI